MQIDEDQSHYNFKEKETYLHSKEDILNEKVNQTLNSIIRKEGYKTFEIDRKIFKDNENGFLGVLCEIDIKGRTDDVEKETNIFVKLKPPGDQVAMLSLSNAYLRELYVYKELSIIYTDLQNEFDVPEKERYTFAKFYDASDKDAMIMENLCRKGFKIYHRMDVVSLEFAELAVKELAKFHALSFVLQKTNPVYFQRKLAVIKQPLIFNDHWNLMLNKICNATVSFLDEGLKKKFETFITRHLKMYKKYLEDDSCICCICHGDYRPANIMKKEIDGKISKIIPIDFQLIYYGSPIHDFLYFIFGATDQKFRRTHINYLKELYYKEISHFLLYFDINVETVLPLTKFEEVFRERLDFGLMSSVVLLPHILASDEAVPDLASGEDLEFNTEISEVFKKRMIELIEDFIEWGYL
ncbi:hypothetical protein K1T71_005897 [Dendrolimus kikuchii]|uniref:Uncharacterized protein n=1 Tax=Dendrolimus kikuchii TaxID=765133 RepID=A0ACC1D2X2_9NEOP|nr:hypothetical protein K1T71_005897 [Dendrolimus kikuchii]